MSGRRRSSCRNETHPTPGFMIESRRSSIIRRKSLEIAKQMDKKMAEIEKVHVPMNNFATANRAFDLCNILYKLTMAETHFSHTNRITAPPVVKAARKWRRRTLRNRSLRIEVKI